MKFDIYKCSICGNIIETQTEQIPNLTCCNKVMLLQKENTTDGAKEKHVPVVEKQAGGYLIKVGSITHPMTLEHHIQLVEIITKDGKVYKKTLTPNDKPEVFFDNVKEESFIVREYCNLHGLWTNNYE
ncbi:MAG: desulfoferrodoxin [Rickettsiales bacterium]|jgi:superoxide reductase|nr:desulfoferrodoxin [Rickettsiales bacterium]